MGTRVQYTRRKFAPGFFFVHYCLFFLFFEKKMKYLVFVVLLVMPYYAQPFNIGNHRRQHLPSLQEFENHRELDVEEPAAGKAGGDPPIIDGQEWGGRDRNIRFGRSLESKKSLRA